MKSPMVKSTAISDAGLTKQTLYEVERANFNRDTYDRAIECMDAVNFRGSGADPPGVGAVMTLTAVKISKNRIVFNDARS